MHSDSSSLVFTQTHCSPHTVTIQWAGICLACTGAGRVPEALQMPPARCQDSTWQLGAARAPKPQTPAHQHSASKHKALAMQKGPQQHEGKWFHSRFYGFHVHPGEPEAQPQLCAAGSPKNGNHPALSSLAGSIISGHWELAWELDLCLWFSKSLSNKASQIDSDLKKKKKISNETQKCTALIPDQPLTGWQRLSYLGNLYIFFITIFYFFFLHLQYDLFAFCFMFDICSNFSLRRKCTTSRVCYSSWDQLFPNAPTGN